MRKCTLAAVLLLSSAMGAAAEIEIEVGHPGELDDYLCWGDIAARVRVVGSHSELGELMLGSRQIAPAGGALGFSDVVGGERGAELRLALPPDGGWAEFTVSGTAASSTDKDVAITVSDASGTVLHEHPVMVRVLKNAETLTAEERDRFLLAFVAAAARDDQFDKYWGLHTDALRLAHENAFLPWHRVLLLQLERELQAEDPSVALPYWVFDEPAPNLFSAEFIGAVDPAGPNTSIVRFAPTNPLAGLGLGDPQGGLLTRARNGDAQVSPALNRTFMRLDAHLAMTSDIFGPYHGSAHTFIGGVVGDILRSPADPLFFLLHANTDRAWAAWQRLHDRFDRTAAPAYGRQGAWSPGSTIRHGNFEQDTMWPWDGIDRPTDPPVVTTEPVSLPANPGPSAGPSTNPQVGETLDYLNFLGLGAAHDFCYDDVPHGVGDVPAFWNPP
ncbi:hypothetical protein BH23PSE1_BH23PSE1_16740 [soil metagenome]